MPFRASHAPSYKQTLAAILKFPITSFMPPLRRHLLLLIEDRLTSYARERNASPTSVSMARSHTNRVPTTWHALTGYRGILRPSSRKKPVSRVLGQLAVP